MARAFSEQMERADYQALTFDERLPTTDRPVTVTVLWDANIP